MKKSLTLSQLLNYYLPPLAWAGFIYFLSNQSQLPSVPRPLFDLVFKQSAHVFVYTVLHFLIWRATMKTAIINHPTSLSSIKLLLIPILLTFLYALTDEFHQSFISGRQASWIDIGFDSMGIATSHYLTHRQKRLHSDKLPATKL